MFMSEAKTNLYAKSQKKQKSMKMINQHYKF